MLKRSLLLIFTITSLFTFYELKLNAAENNSSEPVSVIDRNNQMMMAFTERLKSGNINEARKIAQDITSFSKKYQDNDAIEYKSFFSKIEKELYMLKYKDSKKKVVWVEEPISDGYYFLAVIDCHQKQYKDAINNIQKCIMWNPVRAPYYLERGFIFLNSGVDSNLLSAQVAYEQALELANNEEDFASALRGLGFVFAARNLYEESAAAMILSKKYDSNRIEADEHLLSLKKSIPYFDFNMNEQKAKQILKSRKIQTTYSPEHAKILVKLASEFKIPEQKEKAIAYLTGALILDPQNQEIINKIKVLNK